MLFQNKCLIMIVIDRDIKKIAFISALNGFNLPCLFLTCHGWNWHVDFTNNNATHNDSNTTPNTISFMYIRFHKYYDNCRDTSKKNPTTATNGCAPPLHGIHSRSCTDDPSRSIIKKIRVNLWKISLIGFV